MGCGNLYSGLAWSLRLGVEAQSVFAQILGNLHSQWQATTLNQNGDFQMEWGIALGVEALHKCRENLHSQAQVPHQIGMEISKLSGGSQGS